MNNKIIALGVSVFVAIGIYIAVSSLASLGIIYAKNHMCHYDDIGSFLTRPTLWVSFGILSGVIWPQLPYQLSKQFFHLQEYSNIVMHSVRIVLGMSGLFAWQLLPVHNFVKCAI